MTELNVPLRIGARRCGSSLRPSALHSTRRFRQTKHPTAHGNKGFQGAGPHFEPAQVKKTRDPWQRRFALVEKEVSDCKVCF